MVPPSRAVASAPCNFGVYRLGNGLPDPDDILDVVADAGYQGIDLGPVGFLGQGRELRRRLGARGLALSGGWVELSSATGQGALEGVLAAFDAAADLHSLKPRPTLAAGGPAGALAGHAPELDQRGWDELVLRVEAAARQCNERGYEPAFHPHVGTWVESPKQVDRLLEASGIGLCLDTGHALLGGAGAEDLERWSARVVHVHVKDVDAARFDAVVAGGGDMSQLWNAEVFCELAKGDADPAGALARLPEYEGWLVVEQDLPPRTGIAARALASRERRNCEAVEGWIR